MVVGILDGCSVVGTSTGGSVVCCTVDDAGLESGVKVVNVMSCVSLV